MELFHFVSVFLDTAQGIAATANRKQIYIRLNSVGILLYSSLVFVSLLMIVSSQSLNICMIRSKFTIQTIILI